MANKEFTDLTAYKAAVAADDLFIFYDTSTGIVKSIVLSYIMGSPGEIGKTTPAKATFTQM